MFRHVKTLLNKHPCRACKGLDFEPESKHISVQRGSFRGSILKFRVGLRDGTLNRAFKSATEPLSTSFNFFWGSLSWTKLLLAPRQNRYQSQYVSCQKYH